MTHPEKRKTLAFLLVIAVAIVLIAASLRQLELTPGIPLQVQNGNEGSLLTENSSGVTISINTFIEALLGVALLAALVYCGYKLVKGASIREILRPFLLVTASTLVLLCILFALVNIHVTFIPPEAEVLPPALDIKGPTLAPMPPSFMWLVGFCLLLAFILFGVWLVKWRFGHARGEDRVKVEAEQALQALVSGLNLKNVILRCYRQMSLALQEEQGIELEQTMTAREFERLLEAKGVPSTSVRQLTRLFESARYGTRQPSPDDEQTAIDCLNAIVRFSHERRRLTDDRYH